MAPSPLAGAASLLLNPVAQPEAQRTFVAFGARRGGTSMLAGLMRALGLDVGDVGERKTHEDPRFQQLTPDQLRDAITERNAERDVWGWKFPAAATYLPPIYATIRNPHFVVIYRDPVAAALGQTQHDRVERRRPPKVAMHESTAAVSTNTGFVLAVERPCLLVSHEKAIQRPEQFVDEVADFMFVPRPGRELKQQILRYITAGTYKAYDEYFPAPGGAVAHNGNGAHVTRRSSVTTRLIDAARGRRD